MPQDQKIENKDIEEEVKEPNTSS